jgi:hypothetical protein
MEFTEDIINAVIVELDWDSIMSIYHKKNIISETTKEVPTKDEIQKELKNILFYVIDNDIEYYMFDIFMIVYVNKDLSQTDNLIVSLIYDTLTVSGIKNIEHLENRKDIISTLDLEKETLKDLQEQLKKYIKEENYPKAHDLWQQINSIKSQNL